MNPPVVAFVGLGGNLGDAAATLTAAIAALDRIDGTRVAAASRLYRTPAWGVESQPDFVNAVARVETRLEPQALLAALLRTEREFGRDRSAETRWGPRILDLDLLLHGIATLDEPGLRLPHPHLHERAFVLVPLLEIAPDILIPGHGAARKAAARLDLTEIEPIGG